MIKRPYQLPKPVECAKSANGQHRFTGYPKEHAACVFCGEKK